MVCTGTRRHGEGIGKALNIWIYVLVIYVIMFVRPKADEIVHDWFRGRVANWSCGCSAGSVCSGAKFWGAGEDKQADWRLESVSHVYCWSQTVE